MATNILLQEVWSARVPIIKLRFMDIIDVDLSCRSLRFEDFVSRKISDHDRYFLAQGRCVTGSYCP